MGKATEPPKCKACGEAHWGTCLDHASRGMLADRAAQQESRAKATKGKPEPKRAPRPARVASRASDAPEASQGKPVKAALAAIQKAEVAAAHLAPVTKKGTPRQRAPKGTFDRKAYQREAAKNRRAAAKP